MARGSLDWSGWKKTASSCPQTGHWTSARGIVGSRAAAEGMIGGADVDETL